jgi:5-aminolevulinate synthase
MRPQDAKAFEDAVAKIKGEGRYRVFADILRARGQFPRARLRIGDGEYRDIVVWCSNDYLGQGQSEEVIDAAHAAIDLVGAGAGGTRNISGTTSYHVDLEKELAALHGKEAALLFTSGYVSNDATLSTLVKLFPDLWIFSDAKNHASMIEGIKRHACEVRVFRHNDLQHLEALLNEAPADAPKLIAFESVYSMDGDVSPISEICDIAEAYGAMTYLDEVHGVGLYIASISSKAPWPRRSARWAATSPGPPPRSTRSGSPRRALSSPLRWPPRSPPRRWKACGW